MARKIVVNLDTSKEIYTIFKSKQNDDLILEVNVFENGEGLDLTNKEIAIQALKGDNTYIIQNTDITKLNNTFTAELVRNFTRVPGTTKIEVVLVEGGKQNTTFSFYLEVVGSVIRGAVESKDSITSLEKMQDAVIEIGKINEETQTLLNNAGAASKEEINKVNTQLAEIVKINLKNYLFFVKDGDWSPAMDVALKANNGVGEIYIPPDEQKYSFSRTVGLGEYNSLNVCQGAIMQAIADMDIFIRRHGTKNNLTREHSPYNKIHGGGYIDCNVKAKIGVSLGGYRGYDIDGVKILNPKLTGLISKGEGVEYAVELFVNNLYIENDATNNNLGTTGMIINSTDNHFNNVITVDMDCGIMCTGGGNRFVLCHDWVRNTNRTAQGRNSKGFVDLSDGNSWSLSHADSKNIGFEFTGGSIFSNCWCYNSPQLQAYKPVGFKLLKKPTKTTILDNCVINSVIGQPFDKAFEGFEFINDNIIFDNCKCNGTVNTVFPEKANGYTVDTETLPASKNCLLAELKIPLGITGAFGFEMNLIIHKNNFAKNEMFKVKTTMISVNPVNSLSDLNYTLIYPEEIARLVVYAHKNTSSNTLDIRYYYVPFDATKITIQIDSVIGKFGDKPLTYSITDTIKLHKNAVLDVIPTDGIKLTTIYTDRRADIIEARKIVATGNFQSPYLNFDANNALSQNGGIVKINSFPLIRLVSVPLSSSSQGKYGDFAIAENWVYIYIGDGVGWRRCALSYF